MEFKRGQKVVVNLPSRRIFDEVIGPTRGASGLPVSGMVRTRHAGNVPAEMLEPAWADRHGRPVARGETVRTILGKEAKIVSVDDAGYARLEGLVSTRFVAHLEVIRE